MGWWVRVQSPMPTGAMMSMLDMTEHIQEEWTALVRLEVTIQTALPYQNE